MTWTNSYFVSLLFLVFSLMGAYYHHYLYQDFKIKIKNNNNKLEWSNVTNRPEQNVWLVMREHPTTTKASIVWLPKIWSIITKLTNYQFIYLFFFVCTFSTVSNSNKRDLCVCAKKKKEKLEWEKCLRVSVMRWVCSTMSKKRDTIYMNVNNYKNK